MAERWTRLRQLREWQERTALLRWARAGEVSRERADRAAAAGRRLSGCAGALLAGRERLLGAGSIPGRPEHWQWLRALERARRQAAVEQGEAARVSATAAGEERRCRGEYLSALSRLQLAEHRERLDRRRRRRLRDRRQENGGRRPSDDGGERRGP